MGKKVLVRSRYRNPLVRTTRDWTRGKNGKPEEVNGYRQFVDHHAFMTPMEAAFIVDSDENKAHIDAGIPPLYYYPAGHPLIVDERADGPLLPPLAQGGLVANNAQQADAARKALAAGEASILAREAGIAEKAKSIRAGERSAAQRIETPPEDEEASAPDTRLLATVGGTSAASPLRISNPDLPGDMQAPDFGA